MLLSGQKQHAPLWRPHVVGQKGHLIIAVGAAMKSAPRVLLEQPSLGTRNWMKHRSHLFLFRVVGQSMCCQQEYQVPPG